MTAPDRTADTAPDAVHVLVTLPFPPAFVAAVCAVDPRIVCHHLPGATLDQIPDRLLQQVDVIYTSDVLPGPDRAPRLRWVQLDTSGMDHVAGSPLWDSSCVITTLGGVSPAPLAEWVLMMVLAHAHHLRVTEELQRARHWPTREERWKELMPRNLRRCRMGVVGYGRIGREVARLALAFGMEVSALRRDPSAPAVDGFGVLPSLPEVREMPAGALDEVLAASDYLVLTVPLTTATRGMIGARELALLPAGAVLVNGSRGGVVDEAALLAALDSGHVELYASDVFAQEPLPPDSPWWSHPRSMVTPHVAGFAPDYADAVVALFTENLRRHIAGAPMLNVADRSRGY